MLLEMNLGPGTRMVEHPMNKPLPQIRELLLYVSGLGMMVGYSNLTGNVYVKDAVHGDISIDRDLVTKCWVSEEVTSLQVPISIQEYLDWRSEVTVQRVQPSNEQYKEYRIYVNDRYGGGVLREHSLAEDLRKRIPNCPEFTVKVLPYSGKIPTDEEFKILAESRGYFVMSQEEDHRTGKCELKVTLKDWDSRGEKAFAAFCEWMEGNFPPHVFHKYTLFDEEVQKDECNTDE